MMEFEKVKDSQKLGVRDNY